MYPMLMQPCCKEYLWGGTRLKTQYGKETELETVAETWELSCHPDGYSRIANGPLAGKSLHEVLRDNPQWVGQRFCGQEFPLIVKLIDSRQWLSLQVHPNRELGLALDGQRGKNECWFVLQADPGAQIMLGFQHPMTQPELRQAIADNTILEHVNRIPAAAGDFFYIPAGLIHAIGEGLVILEVQESSTLTYRVYDYDRRDKAGNPRELHVEKALQALDTSITSDALATTHILSACHEALIENNLFVIHYYRSNGKRDFVSDSNCFQCLYIMSGTLELAWDHQSWGQYHRGSSLFLPAQQGTFSLQGEGEFLLIQPGQV